MCMYGLSFRRLALPPTSFRLALIFVALAALTFAPAGTAAAPPPGYYDTVITDTPLLLRTTLHEVIDDHLRFPYTASTTDTWNILELADQNPANAAYILDLYRNRSYVKFGGGERPLQPRAQLAQQLRLSGRRHHQLPVHRLSSPVPLRCRLQQRSGQQAVRRLRARIHGARHRLQRRRGRRFGGVSGQFQLVQRHPLADLERPAGRRGAGHVLHGCPLRGRHAHHHARGGAGPDPHGQHLADRDHGQQRVGRLHGAAVGPAAMERR